ncbi:MAG: ABC transporter permease subunit [Polyangiaceae bacterium]|nr:ABC transporter permease subunit [Polyangiaceae bacterium]
MRHALRRILWIVPTLFVISLGVFWLLSVTLGSRPPNAAEDDDHEAFGAHHVPRFLNTRPTSVRERARAAMLSIANDDPSATAARRELARLGGAALPHVLPELDSLEPRGRSRVALALGPVGKRMNVGSIEERGAPEAAVLFWTRFWADRSIDFRPAVVKRAVGRLGEKSTAGRRDAVGQLDTFALAELLAAMRPIDGPDDVKRARRLAAAAARITDLPWRVPKDATVAEARSVEQTWQRWWLVHRTDYVTHDGAERVVSMLSDTEYGRWATDAAVNQLGVTSRGEPVLDVLIGRSPVTLWLLACGFVGGWLAGILVGLAGAAQARRGPDLVTSAAAVLVAASPVALAGFWLGPGGSAGAARALAAAVMVLTAGAIVSRYQRSATRVALDQEYTRTARAFGAGPWRLARWSFRASSVAALSLLGAHLPPLLTSAFVLEHALGLNGVGRTTLDAVAAHDVAWLMALALVLAASLALLQIVSDAALGALDPRVRLGFSRHRGALE